MTPAQLAAERYTAMGNAVAEAWDKSTPGLTDNFDFGSMILMDLARAGWTVVPKENQ